MTLPVEHIESNSWLNVMTIHVIPRIAPEVTSGCIVLRWLLCCWISLIANVAGRHQTIEGEKNVALFRSRSPLSLYTGDKNVPLLSMRSYARASTTNSLSSGLIWHLPDSTRIQRISNEDAWKDLFAKLMESCLVFRGNRMIINHRSKRNSWPTQ